MALGMRIATGQVHELSDEFLQFAAQMGVSGVVMNTPALPGDQRWEFLDLLHLRTRCESYGLRLESIENVPLRFYDRAMLGLSDRDAQIANYQETIRNVGRAGITVLGYHWMPNGVWSTSTTTPTRGGARSRAFDASLVANAPLTHGRTYADADMWASYEYFMTRVLPVAEESGVTLALHPDDPPVPSLGGIARIMRNFEGFKRAMEIGNSPNHGLNFCMGCWSEMGEDVPRVIRFFGERGRLIYGHFRDVRGTSDQFQECFLGEGNVNIVRAMQAFWDVGFKGFLIDDHVPQMVNDTVWGHRGRALSTGVMIGLLEAIRVFASGDKTS